MVACSLTLKGVYLTVFCCCCCCSNKAQLSDKNMCPCYRGSFSVYALSDSQYCVFDCDLLLLLL